MKKVITYGTYDLLHDGHIHLLQRARALGDYLIVGLSTDSFNLLKHKESIMSYEQRKILLEALTCVNMVIPEDSWEQKIDNIQNYKIDTFVMGNDWQGKFDFLKDSCEVIYLDRTPNVSTTDLKRRVKKLIT